MQFNTQFKNPKKHSEPGKPTTETYQRKWLADGTVRLVKTGERNVYNEIQEAGEGQSLKELINKYENGYIDTINTNNNKTYQDTTNVPNTKIEIYNLMKKAEQIKKDIENLQTVKNNELKIKSKEQNNEQK